MSDYDPARARALLDLYGYVDRDGDGWRERPDGSPLALRDGHRARADLPRLRRAVAEVHGGARPAHRLQHRAVAREPEGRRRRQADDVDAGRVGRRRPTARTRWRACTARWPGNDNLARFQLDAFDRLYDRAQVLPDGPEREALFREAQRIAVAYMPYKIHVHRIHTDLTPPVGVRLPAAAVLDRLVAHGRRRHGAARSDCLDEREVAMNKTMSIGRLGSARAVALCWRGVAWLAVSPWSRAGTARAQGAALCVRGRRNQFRPGEGQRSVLAHGDAAHLRGALQVRPLGAAGEDQAVDRRRHAASTRPTTASGPYSIKPGIYFADDPAFKGKRRELVAQDYVYTLKRFADPANKSPVWSVALR